MDIDKNWRISLTKIITRENEEYRLTKGSNAIWKLSVFYRNFQMTGW